LTDENQGSRMSVM